MSMASSCCPSERTSSSGRMEAMRSVGRSAPPSRSRWSMISVTSIPARPWASRNSAWAALAAGAVSVLVSVSAVEHPARTRVRVPMSAASRFTFCSCGCSVPARGIGTGWVGLGGRGGADGGGVEGVAVDGLGEEVDHEVVDEDEHEAGQAEVGGFASVPAAGGAGVEVGGVGNPYDEGADLLGVPVPGAAPGLFGPDRACDEGEGPQQEADGVEPVGVALELPGGREHVGQPAPEPAVRWSGVVTGGCGPTCAGGGPGEGGGGLLVAGRGGALCAVLDELDE